MKSEEKVTELAEAMSLEEIRELTEKLHEVEVQKIYDHVLELRRNYAEATAQLRKAFEDLGLSIENGLAMNKAQFLKHITDQTARIPASRLVHGVVPKKYQHPTNPSLAWSGRGVWPRWLREYLAQNPGAKLEDLRIRN